MRIILASTSPRRREILALLGLPFDIVPPVFEEMTSDAMNAEEEVLAFSWGKAASLSRETGSVVIGSDTLIVLGREKIGKPQNREDAMRMLSRLSGRSHEILTGVVVLGPDREETFSHIARVEVEMLSFSEREIADYVSVGESFDKAGAYSIQGHGSNLIAAIRGDYLAAVGLPLRAVAARLGQLGLEPPRDVERIYERKQFHNWSRITVLE